MRSPLAPLLSCALASAALPAAALAANGPPLVSVLELRSKLAADEQRSFDTGYFTDRIRGEVLDASAVKVMTRENLLALLASRGKSLADCEGECEVETGRRLGADYVISGEVLRLGATYKLSLRLHDTRGGTLLGTATASGATAEALDQQLPAAVQKLALSLPRGVARGPLPPSLGGPVSSPAASPIAPELLRLRIDAPPRGDWVLKGPDGQPLCQLPCAADVRRGASHRAERQGAELERIDLPDSSGLPVGAATDATFKPARGNRTAGVVTGVAGALITVGGMVALVASAASSGNTIAGGTGTSGTTPTGLSLGLPLGLFFGGGLVLAGGMFYAIWSQPDRFEYSR